MSIMKIHDISTFDARYVFTKLLLYRWIIRFLFNDGTLERGHKL